MQCTSPDEARVFYANLISDAKEYGANCVKDVMRHLAQNDLYYLLSEILGSSMLFKLKTLNQQWLFDRCVEVCNKPNGHLDLWAREHFKSTIITYGKSIQDIVTNPEETIGIFSHTRPIAKGFLRQIKLELEGNQLLKDIFPDILYQEPKKESPKWSEDDGIIVKRKTNPKEATVEAHGLVDGQPTSKHFSILDYDDVVTRESVTTPEQIKKVTEAWELSLNLGMDGGKRRYVGTRYHFNDTYKTMIERKSAVPRIYPATDDGTEDGNPVLLSSESLRIKRRDMGPYIFGCQMLLNPRADIVMGFQGSWIQKYPIRKNMGIMNKYLLVDPASSKKAGSDYTVQLVIGLGVDGNHYLVDGVRDRMNLTERTNSLFRLHRSHNPTKVGYEQYGMMADIEHIEYVQDLENYRFRITSLGGKTSKPDRIRRLIPIFETSRFYLPDHLFFVDSSGRQHDLVSEFIDEEYLAFPVCEHDDMLDCLSRIEDPELGANFPIHPSRIMPQGKTLMERRPT